jgi:hypothetical protein
MLRAFFALFVLVALIGCSGGGGGGGTVNFTMNTNWPAFDGTSENALAKSRSIGVRVLSVASGNQLWAGIINRPSDAAGSTTTRMDLKESGAVNVDVTGYSGRNFSGNITGNRVIPAQVGDNITINSL